AGRRRQRRRIRRLRPGRRDHRHRDQHHLRRRDRLTETNRSPKREDSQTQADTCPGEHRPEPEVGAEAASNTGSGCVAAARFWTSESPRCSLQSSVPAGLLERSTLVAVDEASWIALEPEGGETLRAALRRTLRDAIRAGALREGVRLPASRVLARQLGVSRGV